MEVKMKRLIVSLFVFTAISLGQPDTSWTKTFGGSGYETAFSCQQTIDGGYIILGRTESYGNGDSDAWLIKTDSQGNEEWNHTYGGALFDIGISLDQTTDSGYVIVGWTTSYVNGYNNDVWLIKTDTNGDTLWTKTFGGTNNENGWYVQQTTDGGYIITGYTGSYGWYGDVWLIKTDSNGDSLWTQTFDRNSNPDQQYYSSDRGYSVQQTGDGGYIISGEAYSFGNDSVFVWLIKTDSNGDSLWTKSYGGGTVYDDGMSVQQTDDDGYIIVTTSFGYADVWLIKTDSNGDSLWTKIYGGSGEEQGYSVQQTTDGGYIITGLTTSFGNGGGDVWLIKTDFDGIEEWNQTFGGNGWDKGSSVQQTADGGYIITGYTNSYGNGVDVWLIKTDSESVVEIASTFNLPATYNIHQNYPNPFNPITTLRYDLPENGLVNVIIYDMLGREVKTLINQTQDAGYRSVIWDATNDYGKPVSAGIYLYQIQAGEYIQTKKMVLLK
jgi:hypothetical protein